MARAEIAVVIPTSGRETRLAFALEALAEQTLDPRRFEVVVVRDPRPGPKTEPPEGVPVRFLERPPGAGTAVARNLGWRASSAPLVAFTDDDCRPERRWLTALLAASPTESEFLQGRTEPDPDEFQLLGGLARSQRVVGPSPWYETCNMTYPRRLLERLRGFDERYHFGGEDTDLALRAEGLGARRSYLPEALVWHAVHTPGPGRALSSAWGLRNYPLLLKRQPIQRRALYLRFFWTKQHARVLGAVLGASMVRRRPLLALGAAWPYLRGQPLWAYERNPRGLARLASELPLRLLVDAAEVAATLRGAVRHRVAVA